MTIPSIIPESISSAFNQVNQAVKSLGIDLPQTTAPSAPTVTLTLRLQCRPFVSQDIIDDKIVESIKYVLLLVNGENEIVLGTHVQQITEIKNDLQISNVIWRMPEFPKKTETESLILPPVSETIVSSAPIDSVSLNAPIEECKPEEIIAESTPIITESMPEMPEISTKPEEEKLLLTPSD